MFVLIFFEFCGFLSVAYTTLNKLLAVFVIHNMLFLLSHVIMITLKHSNSENLHKAAILNFVETHNFIPKSPLFVCQIWWRCLNLRPSYYRCKWRFSVRRFWPWNLSLWPWPLQNLVLNFRHVLFILHFSWRHHNPNGQRVILNLLLVIEDKLRPPMTVRL